MPGLSDALVEVNAMNPGEKLVYTHIAREHSVSRTTLSRAHWGVQASRHVDVFSSRKLNDQQEDDMTKYIEKLTARHVPSTRGMVRNFASTLAHGRVPESWVTRFLHRHRNQLTSH